MVCEGTACLESTLRPSRTLHLFGTHMEDPSHVLQYDKVLTETVVSKLTMKELNSCGP